MGADLTLLIQLTVPVLMTVLLIVWFYYAFPRTFSSAPYVPSMLKDFDEVLKEIAIEGKDFIDLGAGDGKVVFRAAKFGARSAVAIEINPFLTLVARLRKLIMRNHNVQVVQEDLFKHPLEQYAVIYTYLLPKTMLKVWPLIKDQCKPGTILISNTFPYSQIKPYSKIGKFYLYRL